MRDDFVWNLIGAYSKIFIQYNVAKQHFKNKVDENIKFSENMNKKKKLNMLGKKWWLIEGVKRHCKKE